MPGVARTRPACATARARPTRPGTPSWRLVPREGPGGTRGQHQENAPEASPSLPVARASPVGWARTTGRGRRGAQLGVSAGGADVGARDPGGKRPVSGTHKDPSPPEITGVTSNCAHVAQHELPVGVTCPGFCPADARSTLASPGPRDASQQAGSENLLFPSEDAVRGDLRLPAGRNKPLEKTYFQHSLLMAFLTPPLSPQPMRAPGQLLLQEASTGGASWLRSSSATSRAAARAGERLRLGGGSFKWTRRTVYHVEATVKVKIN